MVSAGRLEIICGCMFAGKTARLIALLEAAGARGRRVIAFKHRLDARYDPRHLATHDGRRFDSLIADDPVEIIARCAPTDVIGIDEAQFFGRGLVGACECLRGRGQRVIVAGIDNDAWGRPFPPLPQLKAIADAVELMHTACTICGRPARFSQRIAPLDGLAPPGGIAPQSGLAPPGGPAPEGSVEFLPGMPPRGNVTRLDGPAPLTDPDMVGGPAEYQPRCQVCFVPLPPPAPEY